MGKRSPQEILAANILKERINGLESQARPIEAKGVNASSPVLKGIANGVLFVQERVDSPPVSAVKRQPRLTRQDSRTAPSSPLHTEVVYPSAVSVPGSSIKSGDEFRLSRSRSCGSLNELLGDESTHTGDAEVHHYGELRFRKRAGEHATEA